MNVIIMGLIFNQKVSGSNVWKGSDFFENKSWEKYLNRTQKNELISALKKVESSGKSFPEFTRKDWRMAQGFC